MLFNLGLKLIMLHSTHYRQYWHMLACAATASEVMAG